MEFRSEAVRLAGHLSVIFIAAAGIAAAFSGSESLEASSFNARPVDLALSPVSAVVALPGMAPGDKVTGLVTVSNPSPTGVHYIITSTTSEETLAAQLELTIKAGVMDCGNAGFDAGGVMLYGPNDLGSTAGLIVVGGTSTGGQTGRSIDAYATDLLCVRVSLPRDTGNAYQGLATTTTLEFIAK